MKLTYVSLISAATLKDFAYFDLGLHNESAVCDQMSSLALWRYTSAEAGQVSHSAHANAGCFPAPWATFLISTVDPTTTTIRQHYTHGPLSLRSSNRPRRWMSMTKYPNWAHGILASSFFISHSTDRFRKVPAVPRSRYAFSSCLLIGRHSQRSFRGFGTTLNLRTARNMELTYKSPSLSTLLVASSVVPPLLM